jgi:DNA-directed RNA polymerase specialized sigma24 family protein
MNGETLADAINDLIRVTIAFNLNGPKNETVRRLHHAGVKQSRIATLLDIPLKDVTSVVAKMRKASRKAVKGA